MPNSKPGGVDDAIAMQNVREILDRVQVLHLRQSVRYSRLTAIWQEERVHEAILETGGCACPICIRHSTEEGCPSGRQGFTAPTFTFIAEYNLNTVPVGCHKLLPDMACTNSQSKKKESKESSSAKKESKRKASAHVKETRDLQSKRHKVRACQPAAEWLLLLQLSLTVTARHREGS